VQPATPVPSFARPTFHPTTAEPHTRAPGSAPLMCADASSCTPQAQDSFARLLKAKANFATFCQGLKALYADLWQCAYATPECTAQYCHLSVCGPTSNTLANVNGNFTLIVHDYTNLTGTCAYASCDDFCTATPDPPPSPTFAPVFTRAPTSPAPANASCEIAAANAYCVPSVPALQVNASDFDTACDNARAYFASMLSCSYGSARFGNCSEAACLHDACAAGGGGGNSSTLSRADAYLTGLARTASGGLNGTCVFATCEQACAPLPSSSSPPSARAATASLGALIAGVVLFLVI